jgi:PAS domain S-box-containing protein
MASRAAAERDRTCRGVHSGAGTSIPTLMRETGAGSRERLKFLVILLVCCVPNLRADQTKSIRRVVILNEVDASYPLISLIDQGIRTSLAASPYRIEFYREYMGTVLFPDREDQRLFRDFYIRRYRSRRPDVIIAVGPAPLQFMLESHREFFSGVPVVFCLPNKLAGDPITEPDFSGIESDIAPGLTLSAALHLVPGTKHVVVVGGTAPYDRGQQAEIKEQLKAYENLVDISYLTDLSMPVLLERVRTLPDRTIVLLTPIGKDATGRTFTSAEIGPMITSAANAPVFSLTDRYFNHGEVGGDISSGIEQGKLAGSIAARLLNGEKPKDIPRVSTATAYTFDWRALKRWGLKEGSLPPGSIVLNRPPTVWESYKWYIIIGTSLILLEALLIGALVSQRSRRRQMTTELKAREELLKIFVKNVPAGVAMLDRDMRYLQVSERWCIDYGVDASRILGCSHYDALPDMPERWKEVHRRALQGETLRCDEERWARKNGIIWVRWEVRPWFNVDGSAGGILIFAEEITRRKQVEEALSGMNRKLVESQEQERARIARELHDDINQRLALLAVELDQWSQGTRLAPDLHKHIEGAKEKVIDIAQDVQGLSHQLHSSKLEYLGLAAAANSFCKEMSEKHNVQINFKQDAVPRDLATEISIGLFRVIQEALQNAIKHSGTERFDVKLYGMPGEIQLIVRDYGRGFNVDEAWESQGLGLISMRERISSVKGTMVISSKPYWGTEITVHVPVILVDRPIEVNTGAA